ncbi:TVP38/TMEM64 family protein [Paenibacillus ferrarius]|uniref:TVP38/TMEM64 family protein n=1 Tax=Paenibacillus ferrarius TaxID=1469647 RepID=UPI003D2A9AE4
MKKWLPVIIYVIVIMLIFLNKEQLIIWIQRRDSTNIMAIMIIATLFALFPVVPYGLFAGALGAKFGFFTGGIINILASTCAALIMFLIFRYSFSGPARRMIARYQRVEHFTKMFEANAFLAVLFARLIPIIPAQVVNIYSAISRIKFITFTLATVLGKIPLMMTFALLGDQLFENTTNVVITIVLYSGFLLLVYVTYRALSK